MKAASKLPNLEVLDLAGQAFSGTLPTQYPFPKLLTLNLMDNNIMVHSQFPQSACCSPQCACCACAAASCLQVSVYVWCLGVASSGQRNTVPGI